MRKFLLCSQFVVLELINKSGFFKNYTLKFIIGGHIGAILTQIKENIIG